MGAAFAADATYGDYLVMVFDPESAHSADEPDRLPPLAFVWNRSEVEGYAACGTPPPGLYNECSDAFTAEGRVAELSSRSPSPEVAWVRDPR